MFSRTERFLVDSSVSMATDPIPAPAAPWFLPPVLAGVVLRLWNLRAQIVGGDELNGVEAALRLPLGRVLTTYQLADPCLPMAGFYRFLLDRGIALSETWVRLVPLAFGLAALAVVPWIVTRRLGRPAGIAAAWLVALSPLLVLYSRIARPYMPIAFLGFAATAAFEAWWDTRRTRRALAAAVYVVCGGLCVYFHLGSAPLVVAPFLFALGALVLDRIKGRQGAPPSLPAVIGVGLAEVAAFLAFMVPSWDSLRALIGDKHDPLELRWGTLTGVLKLQAGTASRLLAAVFWAAAAWGLVALLRSGRAGDRRLGVYSLTLVAAQIAGLIVLSPEMLVHPLVFDRYLLPAFPWVLVWAAAGLAAPWGSIGRRVQTGLAAAGIAALFAAGPLVRWEYRAGSFAQHNDFVAFFCPPARIGAADVPRFYREVRARGGGPVLELPWFPWWAFTRVYYLDQEVHGQEVLLALARPIRGEGRLAFRNMPRATPEDFLASRARWLVVHTDLPAEEDRVTPHCWPIADELQPRQRRQLLRAGQEKADGLTALWGEPDVREGGLLAWDLERVRKAPRPPSPPTSPG
jgi:Dolichyl-phosphate-mannose-protein mannosyltransferase